MIRALHAALKALDHEIHRQEREAQLPTNAGKSWDPDEDRALSEAFDAGQTVACLFTAGGVHDGPLGPFPPTGKEFALALHFGLRF